MPLVLVGSFPAGLLLGVLSLMLAGAPAAPIYGGFAVVALLPLAAAILRWAVGGRTRAPVQPPRAALLIVPVVATAYVAAPVLIAGTRSPGAFFVIGLGAVLSILVTAAVYRSVSGSAARTA